MIRYIRETRTDPSGLVNECLVVDDATNQYFIVSTAGRQNNTRVYRTDAQASTPNYWVSVGRPGVGGDNVHRCEAIRQLERFLANG
jgi:hypothetical protein